MVLYREVAGYNVDFATPHALAVDATGRIYVAGEGDIQVQIPNAAPGEVVSIQLAGGGTPRCLAVEDKRLYVGVDDHVVVIDLDMERGEARTAWEPPVSKAVLTSIAVWKDNVFVADAGNRVVWRYDTAGKLLGQVGRKDANKHAPGFVVPSPYFDVAVAPDGLLRIVNPGRHRIETCTLDGDFGAEPWGKAGTAVDRFAGCCNPVNFAILPDGGFVTAEKGLTRVKVYDSDGRFEGVVAGPEQFKQHDAVCSNKGGCGWGGLDVAVDSKGRVLVLDPLTRQVRIFIHKDTTTKASDDRR